MKYILALTYEEARDYMRKNPDHQPIILSRPEQLLGTTNPDVFITPRAYLRPDYEDFMDMIRTRRF